MPKILLVNGSPSERSRTLTLLNQAANLLNAQGLETIHIGLRDFPAEDLVLARYDSESFAGWKRAVDEADAIIIGTPLYKASLTGGLKALLDVLPQGAFRGKTLLPIATGGSPGHLLSIDFAIKPILATLGASDLHQGVFVVDAQFPSINGVYQLEAELQQRFHDAIHHLVEQLEQAEVSA